MGDPANGPPVLFGGIHAALVIYNGVMISRSIRSMVFALAAACAACSAQIQPTSTATAAVPTLAQATATPSAAPTRVRPTLTPTPGPRAFTEDFRSNPPYWSYLQVDNGQVFNAPSVQDGFLVFDLAAPDQWAYAIYSGHDYWDVTVKAQAQYRTPGDGAVGLVCRYDLMKGWYELDVYADRTYALLYGQWLTNGVARYTPLYQGESEKIQSDANEIGLQCDGNVLTPIINGTALRAWPELKFGLIMGKAGLAVSSFADAPFTVGFDWAKVGEP
jgi:hypothetical protein